MTRGRALLLGASAAAVAAGAWATWAYHAARSAALARVATQAQLVQTSVGPVEYAIEGSGPPLMMIHGTGGGFDQGLLFAESLRDAGFRIVAPSRFGYLRSAFPSDASPAHQADVLVELLDHLGIERIAVAGGSAGALTAAEFALRHPERVSHLVLIVPAANLTGRDPVEFTALQRAAVDRVVSSDFWFWAFASLAPDQLLRTLLATEPSLLRRVTPDERRRAARIREGLMPISRKTAGLRNDGFWSGTPSRTAFERITVATLIVSCEDDRFGTAATARSLAERVPDARVVIYPDGGHIWLGHDADLAREVAAFVRAPAGR